MQWIEPPGGRPWALIVLCVGSLLLNVVLGAKLASAPDEVSAEGVVEEAIPVPKTASNAIVVTEEPSPQGELDNGDEAPNLGPPALSENQHRVHAQVAHSLARTFQSAAPQHADVLSAVYARLFAWDLDLRRDVQRGDKIELLYEWDGTLAHVLAATYKTGKLGQTLSAFRFQQTGDAFVSYWAADGQEAMGRLKNGPMDEYEQVTALLKDRPSHRGMDFKTPEGTKVISPKAGTVTRANWNVAFNGNCVEVRYGDGVAARFLHLSRTDVRVGQEVSARTVLGLSGNTGRSTAPHLHYELEGSRGIIDPIDYHGKERRQLSQTDMAAFELERSRLDGLLQAGN
jgi:murein DD-endopeptidase